MSIVLDIGNYFVDHSILLVLLFFVYLLIFGLAVVLASKKPDVNPFERDERRSPAPLITDQLARDKVLKLGFQNKLVPEKLDVIVIGSGIGGLATAALLSKAAKRVLVLEQHDQAGGCCHTFTEDGYEFDVGIHYIGNMNKLSLNKFLLDQISCGQIQWDHLDSDFDMVTIKNVDDQSVKLFPICGEGYDSYQTRLTEKFPSEKEGISLYVEMLKKARKSIFFMVIFKVFPRWLLWILIKTRIAYAMSPYFSLASQTVDEAVSKLTQNQELRSVLSYNFGDYGVEPSRSSFLMHAILANHYMEGASYPRGGASELPFHIIPVIENAGGKVLVRARVKKILVEGGKAVGVRVEKGGDYVDIKAELIISDAGVFNTFTNLLPEEVARKSEIFKLLKKDLNVGLSALQLFVGLKGNSADLDLKRHNTWLLTSDSISTAIDSYLKKSLDEALESEIPLLFISSPSARDGAYESRRPGKSAITVVVPAKWDWFEEWKSGRVKNRGPEYEAYKRLFIRKIWNQVLALYPHLEGKVEYMDLGTGLSTNFYLNSLGGEIYGLDHSNSRFNDPNLLTHLRPSTGLPGLLLTGQDIFCCGFMGAAFAAVLTASVVLNRNLYSDLRNLFKKTLNEEGANKDKSE